jgi:Ca-activated chloride channel family protein
MELKVKRKRSRRKMMDALSGYLFADPLWLLAAPLGPLLLLAAFWRERHGGAVFFPSAGRLRHVRSGWRTRLRHLPVGLVAAGVSVGAVALARPQKGSLRENVSTQGVDIVVALDVSGSMAAEDFQPRNRLAVAKDVVSEFVKRRTSDRIGLVAFAGRSLTKAPPTTDSAVLLAQLEDVQLGMLPDGTAIGSGLATSLTRLRRGAATSRAIVLVTDGANNAGEIDPGTAIDIARAMEVRVYAVLVGRGGKVPMPVQVQDPITGQVVTRTLPVEVDIDEELMKRIAERTGGEFFRAIDPGSLRAIFDRIDKLEKSEIKQTAFKRYRELFPPVLAASGALLLLGAAFWLSGLRVAPV